MHRLLMPSHKSVKLPRAVQRGSFVSVLSSALYPSMHSWRLRRYDGHSASTLAADDRASSRQRVSQRRVKVGPTRCGARSAACSAASRCPASASRALALSSCRWTAVGMAWANGTRTRRHRGGRTVRRSAHCAHVVELLPQDLLKLCILFLGLLDTLLLCFRLLL